MPSLMHQRTTVAAAVVIILCLLNSRRRKRRSEGRIAKKCPRRSIAQTRTNPEKRRKTEGKREETMERKETSSCLKSSSLVTPSTSRTENRNNNSQDVLNFLEGESSQSAMTLRNDNVPDLVTPKIEIKDEIEVDEDAWKLQPQLEKEEEPTGNIECIPYPSQKVKIEPEEEDEELEPVASVTIPSLDEDLLEEEY